METVEVQEPTPSPPKRVIVRKPKTQEVVEETPDKAAEDVQDEVSAKKPESEEELASGVIAINEEPDPVPKTKVKKEKKEPKKEPRETRSKRKSATPKKSEIKDGKVAKRTHKKDKIYREIAKLQLKYQNQLRTLPFARLAKEIAIQVAKREFNRTNVRFEKSAMYGLLISAESFLDEVFTTGQDMVTYKRQKTMDLRALGMSLKYHPNKDMFEDKIADIMKKAAVDEAKRSESRKRKE